MSDENNHPTFYSFGTDDRPSARNVGSLCTLREVGRVPRLAVPTSVGSSPAYAGFKSNKIQTAQRSR